MLVQMYWNQWSISNGTALVGIFWNLHDENPVLILRRLIDILDKFRNRFLFPQEDCSMINKTFTVLHHFSLLCWRPIIMKILRAAILILLLSAPSYATQQTNNNPVVEQIIRDVVDYAVYEG